MEMSTNRNGSTQHTVKPAMPDVLSAREVRCFSAFHNLDITGIELMQMMHKGQFDTLGSDIG